MLELRNITKTYEMNGEDVHALRGVSTVFRKSEFVAILGHSGCGKTTLLNIIGGLDKYTSGDLLINGVSTKKYKDRDWDAYRNHSIGFVFQSYNLIPHQTVLSNVELALTISGISRKERRRRAIEALEKVGLGDQLKKKPNQMSGGQMQRVAIARALVNNPEILLADEPTGALDSETSIQVMEIIREIAKDRLVIMVTHNPELAEEYANRIIRIKDGLLVDDSNPCTAEETDVTATESDKVQKNKKDKKDRVSMSFFTALSLSLNNLMTKKGRTFMTSFAGSIGIIGIALILSLSNGINTYINNIQKETLSSYPITITKENNDTFAMMESMMQQNVESSTEKHDRDAVYSNTILYDMFNSMTATAMDYNNLKDFKTFLDTNEDIRKYASAIQYGYDLNMPVYTKDSTGAIVEADLAKLISGNMTGGDSAMINSELSMFTQISMFEEMLTAEDGSISHEITDNYDLVYGSWPKEYNEVVLVITRDNELSDLALYALGFKDTASFADIVNSALAGETIENDGTTSWSYEEICEKKYKIVLPVEKYSLLEGSGSYTDISTTPAGIEYLYNSADVGTELKVSGIIRPGEDAESTILQSTIAYTKGLTDHLIEKFRSSEIMKKQLADPSTDAILGLPFITEDTILPTDTEKAETFKNRLPELSAKECADVFRYISSIPTEEYLSAIINAQIGNMSREELEAFVINAYAAEMGVDAQTIIGYIAQMSDEELFTSIEEEMRKAISEQYAAEAMSKLQGIPDEALQMQLMSMEWSETQYVLMYDEFMPATHSEGTYDENLKTLGYCDPSDPDKINIYSESFSDKDMISEIIAEYNANAEEDDVIEYTDLIELLMSSITSIISGVSYLLIAFVGISLVVSSIMIGIITYISVLERTREIGILRAIGASKRDISNVFNAETLIVGFVSGALGIGISILLCLPINAIIHSLTDLAELRAVLPFAAGFILVAISMGLTLIAGLIPSKVAAKKDPVVALRSE